MTGATSHLLKRINHLVVEGRNATRAHGSDPLNCYRGFAGWDDHVASFLRNEPSLNHHIASWSALFHPNEYQGTGDREKQEAYKGSVRQAVQERMEWLDRIVQSLNPPNKDEKQTAAPAPPPSTKIGPAVLLAQPANKKVFVVHGHKTEPKLEVARFLERLKLEAIILHEQANQGRTIIQKFQDNADVGFAVVLLTADDVGYPAGRPEKQRPRARQNVVLELGFFLAKIGASRVCPLCEDGIELPSDYDGVVYVALDAAGAWKRELAKELRAAEIPFDANDVL